MFPNLLILPNRLYRKASIDLLLRKLTVGDGAGTSEGCSGLMYILFPLLCPQRSDFTLVSEK